MASREDTSRIAKILARATSAEPAEAAASLQAAYKRMRRDNVGIRDLLSLPLTELYQDSLVKLIFVVLDDQPSLSPRERRTAFERFMAMISDRFAAGDETADRGGSSESESSRRESAAEEQGRAEAEQMRQAKAAATAYASKVQEEPSPGRRTGLVLAILAVAGVFFMYLFPHDGPQVAPVVSTGTPIPPSTPVRVQPVAYPRYVVVSQQANLRAAPVTSGKPLQALLKGTEVDVLGNEGIFAQVRLEGGSGGFISQQLLIPIQDYQRLMNLTAKEYVRQRSEEGRIERLLEQALHQSTTFVHVLHGLNEYSVDMGQRLKDLDSAKRFAIDADSAAGIWYSLEARSALDSGNQADAIWSARAAMESDPANADYHVALALATYKAGRFKNLGGGAAGHLLPRLAALSTNAWMIFGLSYALDDEKSEDTSKAAFVLALKLSRAPASTRRYLQQLAEEATSERLRLILFAALAKEASDPKLFGSVSLANTVPPPTSRYAQ